MTLMYIALERSICLIYIALILSLQTQQMGSSQPDVHATQAPGLCCVQQLHLRRRRARRLHGALVRRALQSTDQYLEPHRGHDLPPQWGEFLLHFFSANSIVLNEIAPF